MSSLILCGFPRVGKSTLAQKIAKKIGYFYIDTDDLISENCAQFYQAVGEIAFRKVEKKVIHTLRHLNKTVIACGGGAVLDYDNVSILKKMGKIIYLDFEKEVIKKRLLKKPLPLFLPSLEKFEELYVNRSLIYKSVADIVVKNERQLWEIIASETSFV